MKRLRLSHYTSGRIAGRRGFTLLEIMSAMIILGFIVMLLTQLARMAGDTWLMGEKQANNLSKARSMLDLISQDAQMGIFREDLSAFPVSSGSTVLAFYTRRAGLSGTNTMRDVSLVTYGINSASANSILQRGDTAIAWSDSPGSVPFSTSTTDFGGNLNSIILRDTVPGVVGFKITFVYADGTMSSLYNASNGVQAMGIALAIVDDHTLKQLSAANLVSIRQALEAAATGTTSTKANWEAFLNSGAFWAKYPKGLPTGIQILERYVSLQ
ncbi:MAG: type II secretion system protein J [Chthoniobacteraceae bacterium]